ncbi:hypothetical protein BDY19DRAFT_993109 [Irpex rosettiformis]|uniref:Uncharacterized protein n=1 Tax=Irpex rosettiformis TaxID=378272 RepID=A0ACB8U6C3_9APHY|nr:hypothetical protein BDY19DRAFT_993109 [Irpex rosettiformis]
MQMISEMKSRDYCDLWTDKLQMWTEWCLGDDVPFLEAVVIFSEAMFMRYVLATDLSNAQIDLGVVRYLKAQNDKRWRLIKANPPPKLEPVMKRKRPNKWRQILASSRSLEEICTRWNQSLLDFFFAPVNTASQAARETDMDDLLSDHNEDVPPLPVDDLLIPLREACKDAVSGMRSVPASVYKSENWRTTIWTSGLDSSMWNLARPGAIFQMHQELIDTHNSGVWTNIIGELIHRWTPAHALKADIPLAPPPPHAQHPNSTPPADKFLDILCKYPDLIPNAGNSFSVFFLHDSKHFCTCWNEWLLPGLILRGLTEAILWDPCRLYRRVMQAFHGNEDMVEELPDVLKCIVHNTLEHKKMVKMFNKAVYHQHEGAETRHLFHDDFSLEEGEIMEAEDGQICIEDEDEDDQDSPTPSTSTCPNCINYPQDEQCVRTVFVHEHSIGKNLNGCIMTFAPEDDRVTPMRASGPIIYRSPDDDDLQFTRIVHREVVHRRCGRDVTILVDAATGEAIGGVSYNCFTQDVLQAMIKSHDQVTKKASVRRGGTFQLSVSSKMVPVGARIPQGGAAGDGYAPYAHMKTDTIQAIDAMMAHGRDADLVLTALKPYNPSIVRAYRKAYEAAGLSRLGANGVNMYYCTKYTAPIHPDEDVGISLCCQLAKSGGQDKDLDFVYAQHGVYIETRSNTSWWFQSQKPHGPIMPAASAIGNIPPRTPSNLPKPNVSEKIPLLVPTLLKRTRAASKITEQASEQGGRRALSDVSRRASIPGSFAESSILLDTSSQSFITHAPTVILSHAMSSSLLSQSSQTISSLTSLSSTQTQGGTRDLSPERVETPNASATPAHAAGLYAGYQRPTRRTESLAVRARRLVSVDPLRPEDIVDHGVTNVVMHVTCT